jgi:CRP/FNR family transcriptional regulator, cyclic AMP receptor protein
MQTSNLLDVLRQHAFLEGLKPDMIKKLASMAEEVHFQKNEIIFREGDDYCCFFLLLSGVMALEVTSAGRTLRLQTLAAGEELGWSSLLSSNRKYFQARSLDTVRAVSFDGNKLRQACEQDCEFGYEIMRRVLSLVARRLQATRLQLLDSYARDGVKEG